MRVPVVVLAVIAISILACSASLSDPAPTVAPTTAPPPAVTVPPLATQTPAPTVAPTSNPAQAEIEELRELGLVAGSGTFVPIEGDFTINEARRNYWIYYPIEGSGEYQDFVIGADISWEAASEKSDWWNTGCGFFVRPSDESGLGGYFTAQTADGLPWLLWWKPGAEFLVDLLRPSTYDYFSLSSTGKRTGSQHIVAILQGPELRFLVDGDERIHRDDVTERSGFVGAVVVSGTNKDYGTRCDFSNLWIYTLDPASGSSG